MSKDSPKHKGHVEMTSEIPADNNSISETASCEETVGDRDIATIRTPTKGHENRSCSSEDTHPISPWGSLGEEDNQSTSSNSSWGTAIYTDMRFSMISNAVFFVGACIQTYTSIVDLKDAKAEALLDDDAWDNKKEDDDYVDTTADKIWYALYSIGPFLYIINAIIDIRWMTAQLASPWSWSFWCRCFHRDVRPSSLEIQCPEHQGEFERIIEVNMDDTENTHDLDDDNTSSSLMDSATDASYDSNLVWHILAACVFGLGAICEFYSTFLDDLYENKDDWDDDAYLIKVESKRKWYVSNYKMSFIGMHLYFLSGIIMLIAQRNCYRRSIKICEVWRSYFGCHDDNDSDNESPVSTNPKVSSNRLAHFLMFLGTVFFLCGITIDCTIAYISDPALRHELDPTKKVLWDLNQVTLSICDLVSSVLWNIDAILYICADVLLFSLHKKDSKGRKWLFKTRASCSCIDEEQDFEEDENDDKYMHDLNERQITIIPELSPENDVVKPLMGSSSRISYSSL